MKLSACQQLLPPLLMLCSWRCWVAAHGKADAVYQNSIYNATTRFKAMRSDMKYNKEKSKDHFLTSNSIRADFPCPESAVIAPCTCSLDSNNKTYFDCTFAESVAQLVEVFQQDFPVKELYEFAMANNSAITGFPSFMNGITFESVNLYPGPFTLTDISENFLLDLTDSLKAFSIFDSKLTTDFFPFFLLPSMDQLESLRIVSSDINLIPQIQAPSLTLFGLEYSPFELLVSGTFPIGTGTMTIWVNNNQIHTIEVGSFFFADENSTASNEPIVIDLWYNQLQSLMAGTFPLRNGPMNIHLNFNQISSIEPGTFVLPTSTDFLTIFLQLESNELTTVDEAVFGSILPFITNLFLGGNPLTCGCDIAWLILNEDFLATVYDDATCADGTNLHELDPQQFIDLCY